ncbi:MAG: hypothetical protein VZR36_05285 [Prevotella sp.]|nr:hypothetical protein [Prevotella sp.]
MTYKELLDSTILEDVLNLHDSIIRIDSIDVRDLFQDGVGIHTLEVSVDVSNENRMAFLTALIRRKTKHFEPFNHVLFFFIFPKDQPLLIEELQPFSDWIETLPGDFLIKWGMATHSTEGIRAIVLLQ